MRKPLTGLNDPVAIFVGEDVLLMGVMGQFIHWGLHMIRLCGRLARPVAISGVAGAQNKRLTVLRHQKQRTRGGQDEISRSSCQGGVPPVKAHITFYPDMAEFDAG